MIKENSITVVQALPSLNSGGVERGTLELGKYLSEKGHRSIVISEKGSFLQQLIDEGSEHLNLAVGRKSLVSFLLIPKLRNFLINNRVDIVHARSRFPAWLLYFTIKLIPKKSRPIFITTFHGPYSVNFYSAIMAKGDYLIAVSKMIKKYVLDNYQVNEKHLFLNYRGVDSKYFSYHFKANKKWIQSWYLDHPETKNKILLLLPARITRWKGQEDFISIIKKLSYFSANIHGIIVGEIKEGKSNYYQELIEKVKKLGLINTITFTGQRSDLREIMSISAITFSLSQEPEAFGRVSLESLSMGIPVIAYSHGGVKEQMIEILPEGLISPGNLNQAVKLADKWVKSPPPVVCRHKFTLDNMLKNTLKIYNQSLKEKRLN
ncbi:MAG: glycosyltransferase [Methylophilales bacterium]|nr:glycosyltransferase [Methylophilales bacterium]